MCGAFCFCKGSGTSRAYGAVESDASLAHGLEYDYYSFNTKNHANPTIGTLAGAPGAPTFYSENVRANMSAVTGRISYLFNWGGGPVVAKY